MRLLSIISLLILSLSAFAQVDSTVQFRGQNSDVIKVNKDINVVRPQAYQVPDTCYNQIPYQTYQCRDVTRYRTSCQTIPSSENCWSENERVCRNVTRYREECSTGPSRQVCRTIPSRQVCTERPTREVCRTDSSGQNRCTTVGGGQSCQTVGGGQDCDTIPGERTCRNVSYSDQDCDYVPRRRCETIPSRQQCDEIPYSEEVCGNETQYRQEPYACERTAYRDVTTAKKLTGEILVHFTTNGLVEEFPLQVLVSAKDAKFEVFTSAVKLVKQPKVYVFLKSKEVKAIETATEIKLEGHVTLEVADAKMVSPVFPSNLKAAVFNEANNVLSLEIEGGISAAGSLSATVTAKPKIGKERVVAEMNSNYPSNVAGVAGNKLNLSLSLQSELVKKKNKIAIKLMAPMTTRGELLNSAKPNMEKEYKLNFKK